MDRRITTQDPLRTPTRLTRTKQEHTTGTAHRWRMKWLLRSRICWPSWLSRASRFRSSPGRTWWANSA